MDSDIYRGRRVKYMQEETVVLQVFERDRNGRKQKMAILKGHGCPVNVGLLELV